MLQFSFTSVGDFRFPLQPIFFQTITLYSLQELFLYDSAGKDVFSEQVTKFVSSFLLLKFEEKYIVHHSSTLPSKMSSVWFEAARLVVRHFHNLEIIKC